MTRRNGASAVYQIPIWLAVIGALNWGLVGVFNWDLVRAIFGHETSTPSSGFARFIYILVGLAGIALAAIAPRLRAMDVPRLDQPAQARV